MLSALTSILLPSTAMGPAVSQGCIGLLPLTILHCQVTMLQQWHAAVLLVSFWS